MERRKLDLDYIQQFPRKVEHGLDPQHVEQSDFVAECRYVEGFGDACVAPAKTASPCGPMCSLPLTRPTSTRNWAPPLPSSNCMNISRATSPSSVCWPASMQTKCLPLGPTESVSLSVPSALPQGGGISMEMTLLY